MSISVQFSYPEMPITISNTNSGFFTYSNSLKSVYVSFKPTECALIDSKLYIKHIGPVSTAQIYVVFTLDLVDDNDNNKAITLLINDTNNINLNSLISDELERGDKKFTLTESVSYKHNKDNENGFSSGTHIFEVGGTIRAKTPAKIPAKPADFGSVSTSTPPQKIKLTSGSFATDDIICDTGEVSQTASETYSTKVASSIGFNVGIGLSVIFLLVALGMISKQYNFLLFNSNDQLLGGFNDMPKTGYLIVIIIFFIISFSCFMAYGVRMGKKGNKTNIVTGELTAAILFLVLSGVMLWIKAKVLIEDPAL